MKIRSLQAHEWTDLAHLIHSSTNKWYQQNLNRDCFPKDQPDACRIFPEIYEALDPGCCLIAEIDGKIAGSCFYHPHDTHFSLGIMNASSEFAGKGVAKRLLAEIINLAEEKPIHLVSSGLNLDSYSLYTRAGFRPTAIYQDMTFPELPQIDSSGTRPAQIADIPAIVQLEEELTGMNRDKYYHHFMENSENIWHGSLSEKNGELTGFLFSVNHPGSALLGPGMMTNDPYALALIGAELKNFTTPPLLLAPANRPELISQLYKLGARNCEIHFSQTLGEAPKTTGVIMPSFMPE